MELIIAPASLVCVGDKTRKWVGSTEQYVWDPEPQNTWQLSCFVILSSANVVVVALCLVPLTSVLLGGPGGWSRVSSSVAPVPGPVLRHPCDSRCSGPEHTWQRPGRGSLASLIKHLHVPDTELIASQALSCLIFTTAL